MSIKDGPGEGSWAAFAEKVVAERDAANEAAACDRSALDHCITAMRAAEADRDAARAELKKLEDALVAREMTYCVRGNDLWDLGFVLQEDRNKERWRADQAESALKSLHEAAFLYRDLTRSFGDETADGGDLDRALDEAARGYPKMTPEEKARADGYAAGVLAERGVAAKGHLLRVGADLDAALARERAAANSVLEEAALVFESDRCPEDASITKVWWIYGSKIAAWLRGRKRS